jgi:hypothetical protein
MQIGPYTIRPFVVTLQEMPEKEFAIQEHLRSVGIEAETFNGIHGVTSGLRTTFPYERDAPGSGWNIGVKPVATWLSFYMLWAALNLQPDSHFLTLEWDALFAPNWRERTEAALACVPPDFDLLYLGSCCAEDQPKTHIKGEVFEVRYPLCGHATIVAKKALPIMLSTQRKVYAPIDISLLLHTLPMLKVYTVLPRIVEQLNTQIPK